MGCLVTVAQIAAWLGIGYLTFNWIGVHDFWSAILWIIVWPLVSWGVAILIGIVFGVLIAIFE